MGFLGSKAMILFAPHLLAAEPWLQSDGEAQKLDIYFTDYTLTGQPDAFPSESQDCECRRGVPLVKLSNDASQLYFTDYTLAGQPDAFPSQESEVRLGRLGRALGKVFARRGQLYFTDHTLTGQPYGFASENQHCEWRSVLLVKPSRGAGQLYFTDYTLTGQPILPLPNGTTVGLVAGESPS